ncbi:CFA52 protein, partial [Nycticryphes semicollaris]|nr:CFA52 protein [Nycticryphes semicollaris]
IYLQRPDLLTASRSFTPLLLSLAGHIVCGLICHPNKEHILYPLGCTIVIQKLDNKKQTFLRGHTNDISCLVLSKDGVYIASGQVTLMNRQADVILWDFHKAELLSRFSRHRGNIEDLAFSPSNRYLVSLGGQDDGSVMVWDIAKRECICRRPASLCSMGNATIVECSTFRDDMFVTAGNGTIRVWELDVAKSKIEPTECQIGKVKRVMKCIRMAEDDSAFYIGTTSGDILKVSTKQKTMSEFGPQKKKFAKGVTALLLLDAGDVVVGTGDGVVALCRGSNYKIIKKIQVHGAVTSLTNGGQCHQFFVGTDECQIYLVNCAEFKEELITVCHSGAVNDIVFPFGYPEVYVTCSKNDIRVWHTPKSKELLRIVVPNLTCNALELTRDGTTIISAWNDGKIRAFTPETGKPMYTITHAHSVEVTAIAATSDAKRIISGGSDGQVMVWEIGEKTQKLLEFLKEHKSAVSCIKIKDNDQECVTTSLDRTCIVWDIVHFVKKQVIHASTVFKCVCYHPEVYQIITSGTDRKIVYWEVLDGSPIREIIGSMSSTINGMDITSDGRHFVTGGDDFLVKLWDYNEGIVTHIGVGHSGKITRLKICPDKKYIVSVSADGAILLWKYPESP